MTAFDTDTLAPWVTVWREGIAPFLPREGLIALREALRSDDPQLVQHRKKLNAFSLVPPNIVEAEPFGFCLWKIGSAKTHDDVAFHRIGLNGWAINNKIDLNLFGEWWKNTPRAECFRLLLAEVERIVPPEPIDLLWVMLESVEPRWRELAEAVDLFMDLGRESEPLAEALRWMLQWRKWPCFGDYSLFGDNPMSGERNVVKAWIWYEFGADEEFTYAVTSVMFRHFPKCLSGTTGQERKSTRYISVGYRTFRESVEALAVALAAVSKESAE